MDLDRREIHHGDRVTRLSEQEAALLRHLAARAGRPVPREELLAEVLGHRANAPTRALDNAMMRLRHKLGPEGPLALRTLRGVGFELDPAFVLRASPGASAPPGSPVPGARPDGLVGREDALAALSSTIASREVAMVVGLGGVGKTELVRASECRTSLRYRWVLLAGVTEAEATWVAVAHALGASLLHPAPPVEVVRAAVAAFEGVLVLDAVEGLADCADAALGSWLGSVGPGRVVITSRRPIALRSPLAPEPGRPGWIALAPLSHHAAIELFLARAAGAIPVDDDLHALVDELDGVPLALELAAGWTRLVTPRQLRERMRDRFHVLRSQRSSGSTAAGSGTASLEAVLEDTWAALGPADRESLTRLAVLSAPMTLELAESILERLAFPLGALAALCDRAVVRVNPGPEPTYQVLRTVRAYALEHGDRLVLEETAARVADALVARLVARPTVVEISRYVVHLEALVELLGPGHPARVADLTACLHVVAWARGPRSFGDRIRTVSAAMAGQGPPASRLRIAVAEAQWTWREGRHTAALALLEQAIAVAQSSGNLTAEAHLTRLRGYYAFIQGDAEATEQWSEGAVALARSLGERRVLVHALRTLAHQALADREHERARELADEAADHARELDDGVLEATCHLTSWSIEIASGDRAAASRHHERASALAAEHPFGSHMVHHAEMVEAERQGDDERVLALLGRLRESERALGDAAGEAISAEVEGRLAGRQGRLTDAEKLLGRALRRFRDLGMVGPRVRCALQLAGLLALRGRAEEARGMFEEARAEVPRRSSELGPVSVFVLEGLLETGHASVESRIRLVRAPSADGPEPLPIDQVLVRWLEPLHSAAGSRSRERPRAT